MNTLSTTTPLDPDLPIYRTVVHALAHAAGAAPGRVALICEERAITYAQYARAAAGLALHLRGLGAGKGDRIVLMMGNSIEMAVAMMGVLAAHAQMVPFNPNYTDSELRALLADAEPAIVICDESVAPRARALAGELGIAHVETFGGGGLDIAAWIDDAALALPEPFPAGTDLATLPYTGGTTGLPKGAVHEHGDITIFFAQIFTLQPFGFDRHRYLTVAPMFHIWGFQSGTWVPIYGRSTLVIVPRYKPELVLRAIEEHDITIFSGGPAAIFTGLMGHENFSNTDFSSLEYCLAGGSPCPEDLLRNWEARTGCMILESWGMSEGAPINLSPIHGKRKILSVGVPAPLTQIEIVDLETGSKRLPIGERGEVRVKGPQFTKAYRNRALENAETFREGWLYTGDIGYVDEDDYLFLVDRKKEMVLVGGYNVYPREIDELLFNHPAIAEAAAIGIDDEFRGEVIKAFVTLKPGATLSEDEIIAYCGEHLVKYKIPVAVEFMDEIPKSGAGKIGKKVLRAREAAAKAVN